MKTAPLKFLSLGELYFGDDRVRIQTVLGTCVAITLWHPLKRLGGICHYLLPTRGPGRDGVHTAPAVYGDEAMRMFMTALRHHGTDPGQYRVRMFGGGSMFMAQITHAGCRTGRCADSVRSSCQNIGCRNVQAGRRLLAHHGFGIAGEDVGGYGSRNVTFDVRSGETWVRRGEALDANASECA